MMKKSHVPVQKILQSSMRYFGFFSFLKKISRALVQFFCLLYNFWNTVNSYCIVHPRLERQPKEITAKLMCSCHLRTATLSISYFRFAVESPENNIMLHCSSHLEIGANSYLSAKCGVMSEISSQLWFRRIDQVDLGFSARIAIFPHTKRESAYESELFG